jgi:selenocysteine lyase/cysteine desulfurase
MTEHRSPPGGHASFPSLRLGGEWQLDNAYLDSASYGLPPRAAYEALQSVLAGWRGGRESAVPWNDATERSRQLFGELVGARVDRIATGSAVSPFVGLIAAALPKSRVLASDIEFSSLLWPWLAWDCNVRTVPSTRLAESIDGTTDVVLVSAVSSVTGEVADLDAIVTSARSHGAFVIVDATHGCGWLPLDAERFDAMICAGYKWLLSPRGTAFLTVGDELLERLRPIFANWYAPDGFGGAYFGLPMPASPSARRLDLSPIWFSWIGTAPALEALLGQGVDEIYRHNVALANRFRAGLGLDASNSAIVTAELNATEAQFERAQVRLLVRDGRLRAAFHLYNNEADVERALEAL